jgi:ABC-2 type transport system ATP-binding protein
MTAPSAATSLEPVAVVTGVSRTFGEVQALRGLDLVLPAGIVGVLGPNGAGKSTLFRLLLGLDTADQGEVTVLGRRMPDFALEVRARVGYMPEDDSLFPNLHGLDQVVLAAQLCGLDRADAVARAHQALDLVGLTDARYRMASGCGWPWRWCTVRVCCCWMSRPRAWTPKVARKCSPW